MSVSKSITLSLAVIIASFLVITGCEQGEDQVFEPQPNVFSLMEIRDANRVQQWQSVKVDQSYDIKDTISIWGVREADVRIFGGSDTFTMVDSFYNEESEEWEKQIEGWYCEWLELDDTTLYTLEVALPWGDTVTGQSYIPSPVELVWPVEGETISLSAEAQSPHLVTWNSCRNVGLYTIQCVPDVDTSLYDEYSPFLFIPSFTADTSYQFFIERYLSPWEYDIPYILRINAYGIEYASYVQLGLSMGRANLTDQDGDTCYGIFSGISIDSVRVYITE